VYLFQFPVLDKEHESDSKRKRKEKKNEMDQKDGVRKKEKERGKRETDMLWTPQKNTNTKINNQKKRLISSQQNYVKSFTTKA